MGVESSTAAPAAEAAGESEERLRAIQRMDSKIRDRVRGGIQYNMKIILKGERKTGKSSLFQRFQGQSFTASYTATPEIQCATINWDFKNHQDNVKVEVWDVVDKGFSVRKSKTDSHSSARAGAEAVTVGSVGKNSVEVLDASIVDVYSGTHAVIFLVSPFDSASLQYVRDSVKDVGTDVPLLVLLNFKDKVGPAAAHAAAEAVAASGDQMEAASAAHAFATAATVSLADVEAVCRDIRKFRAATATAAGSDSNSGSSSSWATADPAQEREQLSFNVYCFEISVYNCFGMMNLHRFLDIPFLHLKRKSLLELLRNAENDRVTSHDQLCEHIQSSSEGYSAFEEAFNARQREREQNLQRERETAAAQTSTEAVAAYSEQQPPQQQQQQRSSSKSERSSRHPAADVDVEIDKVDFSFLRNSSSSDSHAASPSSPQQRRSKNSGRHSSGSKDDNIGNNVSRSPASSLSLQHHIVPADKNRTVNFHEKYSDEDDVPAYSRTRQPSRGGGSSNSSSSSRNNRNSNSNSNSSSAVDLIRNDGGDDDGGGAYRPTFRKASVKSGDSGSRRSSSSSSSKKGASYPRDKSNSSSSSGLPPSVSSTGSTTFIEETSKPQRHLDAVPETTAAAIAAAAKKLNEKDLDTFLLPSDDEERTRAENKNKIRAHLKVVPQQAAQQPRNGSAENSGESSGAEADGRRGTKFGSNKLKKPPTQPDPSLLRRSGAVDSSDSDSGGELGADRQSSIRKSNGPHRNSTRSNNRLTRVTRAPLLQSAAAAGGTPPPSMDF